MIWSVLYGVVLGHLGLLGILKALITASAAAQMYYLLVYMQLVLLTPLLYKGLKACPILVYSITPAALIVYELVTAMGHPFPLISRLFPMWLLFYVVGLDWARWRRLIEGGFVLCLALWAGCLCLQFVEGFWWNAFGDYNMATTQIKLTSMASSLAGIAVLIALPEKAKAWASGTVLVKLGNVSFGVYLCHMLALAVVASELDVFVLPVLLVTVLKWVLTLGISCVFCVVAGRLLPRKIAGWIGF